MAISDREARNMIETTEARLWLELCSRPNDEELKTNHDAVFRATAQMQPRGPRANISNMSDTIENVVQNVDAMKAQGKYPVVIMLPRGLVTIYMNKVEMIVYENYVAMVKSVVTDFNEIDDLGWQLWMTIRNGAKALP
jgi:hypothetical protein